MLSCFIGIRTHTALSLIVETFYLVIEKCQLKVYNISIEKVIDTKSEGVILCYQTSIEN